MFTLLRRHVLTLPTTPRPRTVSRVPDRLKILQCRSLSWTTSLPMFSRRMQYLHCKTGHKCSSNLHQTDERFPLRLSLWTTLHDTPPKQICYSPSTRGSSGPPEDKTKKQHCRHYIKRLRYRKGHNQPAGLALD